jgi:hypothetical protein
MIIEEIKHLYPDCGSDQLKRNEFTGGGKQKYKCKAGERYGSLNPQQCADAHAKSWPMPWAGAAQIFVNSSRKTYRRLIAVHRR